MVLITDLQRLCKDVNLPPEGDREEIVQRLIEFVTANPTHTHSDSIRYAIGYEPPDPADLDLTLSSKYDPKGSHGYPNETPTPAGDEAAAVVNIAQQQKIAQTRAPPAEGEIVLSRAALDALMADTVKKALAEFQQSLALNMRDKATPPPEIPPPPPQMSPQKTTDIIDKVRKWNCKFEDKDPLAFLERVEELRAGYNMTPQQMLKALPELLKGRALLWYRNEVQSWNNWDEFEADFREQFVPASIRRSLEEEIRRRVQGPGERISEYVTSVRTLIRRHGGFSAKDALTRIYDNLHPEYRLHIKRAEFTEVKRLIQLGFDYEETLAAQKTYHAPPSSSQSLMPETACQAPNKNPKPVGAVQNTPADKAVPNRPYDRKTHCWKCKHYGHTRTECRSKYKKFCSCCGKDDVLTRDCNCPGNQYYHASPTHTIEQNADQNVKVGGSHLQNNADDRIFIKATIFGKPFQALIDTGAAFSLVGKRVLDLCKIFKVNLIGGSQQARLADGSTNELVGEVTLQVTTAGKTFTQRFLVMPQLDHDIFFGIDAIRQHGVGLHELFKRTNNAHVCRNEIPVNLVEVCGPSGLAECSEEDRAAAEQILREELVKFEAITTPTHVLKHHIRAKPDTVPIKQKYRPRNPAMQQIINDKVDEMLERSVIERSNSPWSSPIVLVNKKDGKKRFCIDYRRVNQVTIKDAYPLPQINATLDKLRGARYLSVLDLKDGYWQMPLTDESKEITAFTAPGKGLYHFCVCPFGLHSSGASFQRLLDTVIGPDMDGKAAPYQDDIIIMGRTMKEHNENLREVLKRLLDANLKINGDKCQFFATRVRYLGHIVDRDGIRTDPDKVEAIVQIPPPKDIHELRHFLGMAGWYSRFIADYATVCAPLNKLNKPSLYGKKGKRKATTEEAPPWEWGPEQQQAFETIKRCLTSDPVLACPDFTQMFTLQTDASQYGLGAVLTQGEGTDERVIAYASSTLTQTQRNYSATERECLAVVWGIFKFKEYLEGYSFKVITDHEALKWLNKIDNPTGRIASWALQLQQHDFTVEYRRGALNFVADALSRHPIPFVSAIDKITCQWYLDTIANVQARPQDFPHYCIREGHLYRHCGDKYSFVEPELVDPWKMCVPKDKRNQILQEVHDTPTAGHRGIAKTTLRCMQAYYWPRMSKDIKQYVQKCMDCQKRKAISTKPAGLMHATVVQEPWENVSIDLIGKVTRSNANNSWLLVMQDRFTKWVEAEPLRDATATTIIPVIKDKVILKYGCPRVITTDNGPQFISKAFEEALKQMNIEHRKTPPYTPQCNPVERANRDIKDMLSIYMGENQKKWDIMTPEVIFAFNTSVSATTGFSPAYLNFGRELRSPGTTRMAIEQPALRATDEEGGVDQEGLQLKWRRMREAYDLVRELKERAFEKQAKHYNLRHREWRPSIGDAVLREEHVLSSTEKGITAKLTPRYEGPFVVKSVMSPVMFRLRHVVSGENVTSHVSHLKPYVGTVEEDQLTAGSRGPPRRGRKKQ